MKVLAKAAIYLLYLQCFAALSNEAASDTAPTAGTDPALIADTGNPTSLRLVCDGLPYVDQGTSMIPVRPVCEFLESKLTFHDGLLTIVKTFGEPDLTRSVSMRLGGKSAQIWDGGSSRTVDLQRAPEMRLNTIFVPAKFIVEILGGELQTDKNFVPQSVKAGARQGIFVSNYDNSYKGSDAARVVLLNRVGGALSLRLTGPQKRRVEIGRNDKIYLQIKPGMYYYQAASAGMQTINNSRRLLAGRQTTWAWGKK